MALKDLDHPKSSSSLSLSGLSSRMSSIFNYFGSTSSVGNSISGPYLVCLPVFYIVPPVPVPTRAGVALPALVSPAPPPVGTNSRSRKLVIEIAVPLASAPPSLI